MNYTLCDTRHVITKLIIAPFLLFYFATSSAMEVPIYDFPITAYSQNANDYLPVDGEQYDKGLVSTEYQNAQLKQLYKHYYASDAEGLSPWSEQMVSSILPLMKKIEPEILDDFNNQNKANEDKHYAENFKEHDQTWWNKIKENMDLYALAMSEFKEENRAISVTNTYARALPDTAPDFFHASLPGQGFPFDNLQESAIWAGTPLYVFSMSKDKAWSLVLTPDGYFAWVKSTDIAYVSSEFVSQWQKAAHHSLIAITQTEASIVDSQQQFKFTGYIGAVFPMIQRNNQQTSILIPVKNNHNQALIKTGIINTNASTIMPLTASPKNLVKIMNQLINRPYGWGGAFFFNDCSQELKAIFTPFGIWLPRNSAQQAQLSSTLDLSKKDVDERISLLKEKGHPLMTIIYIGGHVMLYVGNKDIEGNKAAAITYQNLWGMTPESRDKRYVIGQSLFFPLLKQYSEYPDASSLAGKSNFKLVYLDELNLKADTPQSFANLFLEQRTNQ
ncbi:SH3 domain-containing protein [Legionella quateirensis]|uniref:SH3 domain of the SH3b1 type n=1 Tax=Legionella quateirensis TaxID=45072 RepID=A0A378KNX1_9GAMM|nr:SH3 domain-containing protein [Legionella quateirensis]KTD44824.1 SH3 domain of the SH3b1 type [Legionella quateirensis]STY16283.1 SH3 domain of the SH3b1 type [Legionella quateirensis]